LVIVALVITFAVLIAGGRIERWLHKKLVGEDEAAEDGSLPRPDQ